MLVAQSCPTLCDCSPPGSSVHEIFPGKDTGVGCHFLLQGIFPTKPGIKARSPALQPDSLPSELEGKPGYGFSSSHVWMWELGCEENWVMKNWCFWTMVLEKTLESPLDCKEIQPVHSEDQSWAFFGRNNAKAETPVLWPPHEKNWLIGKDWCWEGLEARREGDNRGWDGWMASPTWWAWIWVNSRSWWWRGRPGMLPFMGLQRVGHDWATELNWTEGIEGKKSLSFFPPWEFQTPLSLGTPRLLINLPRKRLSHRRCQEWISTFEESVN